MIESLRKITKVGKVSKFERMTMVEKANEVG